MKPKKKIARDYSITTMKTPTYIPMNSVEIKMDNKAYSPAASKDKKPVLTP